MQPAIRRALWTASAAISLFAATSARASDWTNATGNGLWNDPGNWSAGVPTAGAQASFFQNGGVVTLPNDARATFVVSAISQPVTFQGGRLTTSIISASLTGAQFTINSDIIPESNTLQISGPTVNGTIGDGAGGGAFALNFSGVLRSFATNTGATTLGSATLSAAGSVRNASSVAINGNSAILYDPTNFPGANRLPDANTVRLRGGVLNVNGGSTGSTSETTGTLALQNSNVLNLVGPAAGSGSLVLTAAALSRDPGSVLEFSADATSQLRFVTPPTATTAAVPTERDVLGFGVGTVSDGASARRTFLTYDDATGLRPLAWSAEHVASIVTASPNSNVRVTGAQSLPSDTTIRSLNLADGSLQLNGARLNIASGGLIAQGATTSGVGGSGTLQFDREATVFAFDGRHVIASAINAPALTKGGSGELALTHANAIAGTVYLSAGTLTSGAAGALGAGTVVFTGGTLRVEASQSIAQIEGTSANIVTAAGTTLDVRGVGTFTSATLTGAGAVHLPDDFNAAGVFNVNGGELQVDGVLTSAFSPTSANVRLGGGKLSGHGTIDGIDSRIFNNRIAPGRSDVVGRLTTNMLTVSGSAFGPNAQTFELDLDGLDAGVSYDQIRVLQSASLSQISFDLSVGYAAQLGDTFIVIDNTFTGAIGGAHAGLTEGSTFNSGGYQFRISYLGGDGNDVSLTVVPEPAMAGLTFLAIGVLARRRRVLRLART